MLTKEQIDEIVRATPPLIPRKKVPMPEEELKVATEKALSYEQEVRRAERMRLRQEEIRKQEEERERVYWERRRALEAHQGMQAAIMNAEYDAKQKPHNLGAYDPFGRFDREMRGDND
jgi:hypothetical protein